MHFLYPNVLWGLLVLGVPVLVHLFNFRRTKKVLFSNVSLLKAVETKSTSFRKLKNRLILLARMLFFTCLIFAFAQPNFSSEKQLHSQNAGMNGFYLDNSLSLENTIEGKRLLDLSIIKMEELLSIFNHKSNLQLSTNDFDGADNFVQNASKIKDRLRSIDFSESPRSLEQVYKRQHSIAMKNNSNAENQLFWFSDFQKSSCGNLAGLKIDEKDHVNLVPIQGKKYQNVFIDSAWLNVPLVREMQTNQIKVRVFNSGTKIVDKMPLKLYIDGLQTSTSSASINANSFTDALFNFTVKDKGLHKCKIVFDDQPISFDNDYYFTLNASPTLRILHLFGTENHSNYISKMYANDSLFNFKSQSILNIDPEQIKNADFIVLENIQKIEGLTKTKLIEFVKTGVNIAFIPSESIDLSNVSSFLQAFGINIIQVNNNTNDLQIPLNEPDKTALFYLDVFEKGTFNSVVSVPKMRWKLKWSGPLERILTLKNGYNFLTKTKAGQGNVFLFGSSLNPENGNFAEHAYFVPTFYKMASLSGKSDRLAYSFKDQTLSFYLPNAKKNDTYKLKNDKLELIPIQKVIDNTLFLNIPKSSELTQGQDLSSGFFDLMLDGKTIKTLAINHDKQESKLDCYGLSELKEIFKQNKNVKIYDGLNDASFLDNLQKQSDTKPYWKYLIMLALLFILAEIGLIKYFKNGAT